jgi:hypothetical protein
LCPHAPGSIFDVAIEKGWLGTATDAVEELTAHRATSVAEFAEHIDVLIETVEPSLAFASNRSR